MVMFNQGVTESQKAAMQLETNLTLMDWLQNLNALEYAWT